MEIYYKFRKEFVMENKTVEKLVKENKDNMVTTTQLRQLLSNSVIVKNKISSNVLKKEDKLSDKLLNDVKYLLIKHTYQCGRESKVKEFDKKFEISEKLKKIKTKEDFDKFYRYLEEIVAYVKYYIG
jgi:CRISPR-associated protein, csm2 family